MPVALIGDSCNGHKVLIFLARLSTHWLAGQFPGQEVFDANFNNSRV